MSQSKFTLSWGSYVGLVSCTLLLLLAAQAAIVYCVDPFGYFRGLPKAGGHYPEARYAVPGVIEGMDAIDLVTVGTSMSEGFRPEMFGVRSDRFINVAFSAGRLDEEAAALEAVFRRHRPHLVIWELNPTAFLRGSVIPAEHQFPNYLYDGSVSGSARYLMMPGAVGEAISKVKGVVLRERRGSYDDEAKWAEQPALFGAVGVLKELCSRKGVTSQYRGREALFAEKVRTVIAPIVAAHKDTEFVFFLPGFSKLLYLTNTERSGLAIGDLFAMVAEQLGDEFENVRFISFAGAPFVGDMNYFKDVVHHDTRGFSFEAARIMAGDRHSPDDIRKIGREIVGSLDGVMDQIEPFVSATCRNMLRGRAG